MDVRLVSISVMLLTFPLPPSRPHSHPFTFSSLLASALIQSCAHLSPLSSSSAFNISVPDDLNRHLPPPRSPPFLTSSLCIHYFLISFGPCWWNRRKFGFLPEAVRLVNRDGHFSCVQPDKHTYTYRHNVPSWCCRLGDGAAALRLCLCVWINSKCVFMFICTPACFQLPPCGTNGVFWIELNVSWISWIYQQKMTQWRQKHENLAPL